MIKSVKKKIIIESAKGKYIYLHVFNKYEEMICYIKTQTKEEIHKNTEAAFLHYHYSSNEDDKKHIGDLVLVKDQFSLETIIHEVQHLIMCWIVSERINPYGHASYANERVCYAAGKITNTILEFLFKKGYTIKMEKARSTVKILKNIKGKLQYE